MKLLIDDMRSSKGFDITARTATVGKQILLKLAGSIGELHIDHDLGCKENGCDIVRWALEIGCLPDAVTIVSMNPVGANNIASILLANGYNTINGSRREFILPHTAKIERCTTGGGSFETAVCPYCTKSKILGGAELTTMYAICSDCGKKYLLIN